MMIPNQSFYKLQLRMTESIEYTLDEAQRCNRKTTDRNNFKSDIG